MIEKRGVSFMEKPKKHEVEDALMHIVDRVERVEESQKESATRLNDLERNEALQDKDIKNLTVSLDKIQENTLWLRRTVTNAMITGSVGFFATLVTGIIIWAISK
ncbi:BH0246 [Halalkalibacterium halodurans C-125]|uniref:BH0246 protein n=4 Tax=Halalkalibacterium halodurans TaxID=86665 RepID=Q9KG67_HALH5|nr:BH0246 [Halalkalibacterium halodurans C-125]